MYNPGLPERYDSHATGAGDYAMTLRTASGAVTEVFTPSEALSIMRDILAKMLPGAVVITAKEERGSLGHSKTSQTV